ncbi:MAG: hypothetical protein IKP47_04235 [Ruminococcus sp.]|nr:hypothetical protein [Ruminococcus sp.]
MKRTLILLAAVTLAGCSPMPGGEPDVIGGEFRSTAVLSDGFAAEAERSEGSGWSFTLTAPETVKGLSLAYFDDGKCTVTFEGHSGVYMREQLPEYGELDLIASALEMCIKDRGVTASVSGEKTVRTGAVRGIGFTVTSEGGRIEKIELNGGGTAEFGTEIMKNEQ